MLHFLCVLFERTIAVVTKEFKGARTRSERITRFRDFMSNGQTRASVGAKRKAFYEEIAAAVGRVSCFYRLIFYIFLHFTEDENECARDCSYRGCEE
jgi:hypothetical protein